MSLTVYLKTPEKIKEKCECCGCGDIHFSEVYETLWEGNITHNLGRMASELGIYTHLWRPEELDITEAKSLIYPLKKALKDMNNEPQKYVELEPENKWGTFAGFRCFVSEYLKACKDNPTAIVEVCR